MPNYQTKKFINYNHYNNYKYYKMENTTIAISKDVKENLLEFGNKGETYSDILRRILKSARERQLHDLLMSEEETTPIEEALTKAKKRWQK
jgi:predicted CopG family antitoxin